MAFSKNFLFHRCGRTALLAAAVSSTCSAQSLQHEADSAGVLIGTAVRPSQFSEAVYKPAYGAVMEELSAGRASPQ